VLQHALNTLNTAAGNVMNMSKDLTFDEGGTARGHRRNPTRQFNGAKPQKFRIDHFLLLEAHDCFTHHTDVHGFPMTQKVVLSAVIQTKMRQCADGVRHSVMDNRHQCPQLASLLLKRRDINSTGSSRLGRAGWDRTIFNLKKSRPKGTVKMAVGCVLSGLILRSHKHAHRQ